MRFSLLGMLICTLVALPLAGCGGSKVVEKPLEKPLAELTPPPKYSGPKTVTAVLPLGLSARAAAAYPHLLAEDMGWGIHQRLVETLFDTNRFSFVEGKSAVIKDVLSRQWLSRSGMIDQTTAIQMGKRLGARKVIYGEVFDFVQGGGKLGGVGAAKDFSIRMGVQVRCLDVETREYVPGSGIGKGHDAGEAADQAVRLAVEGLVRRLN